MSYVKPGPRTRPEIWKHNRNCYDNHGCRCTLCVEDYRRYQRDYKTRRTAGPTRRYVTSAAPPADPVRYHTQYATWPELVAAELDRLEDAHA